MADDGSAQSTTVWALPKFHFLVKWDDQQVSFNEVSGLSIQSTPIEYRHGDSPIFSPIKMPGLQKCGNVTFKKGVFKSDNKFWEWFNLNKMNTIKRKTVVIQLLDESAAATMTWTLHNAFPTKITGTDLKSIGNEVAVESLEMAYETMETANG